MPGDCDADVDAEQPREQGGGQFGGEAEQRGRASLSRRDPQFAETVRAVGSAEGSARAVRRGRAIGTFLGRRGWRVRSG